MILGLLKSVITLETYFADKPRLQIITSLKRFRHVAFQTFKM